ncbi:hypothetical protein BP5796_12220 [Coleophoma crateriformis]|uniref:Xaa-Pro dipeptidyl-peptidase C-terminal domain-containing protein n=1 Tax=Coleophoma crateriformis TaxID=565419 RepID=A0A3D8Q9E9_9HELO|nr:hypothetical protein BP5796_12220 [Coleophoma crateriformis]
MNLPKQVPQLPKLLENPLRFFRPTGELTGPLSTKIFVSSSATDADLFVILQAFSPESKEADFQGTVDPRSPLAQGCLGASHRKLDMASSKPYRPFYSHDEILPVTPHEVCELDVEIWPTCVILPAGYRIGTQISGHDFEREPSGDADGVWVSRGSGPWLHTSPVDRPKSIFGGKATIHMDSATASYLTLPDIAPH